MSTKPNDVEVDFTQDPYWGKGGRYVVDPVTGQRVPAPVIKEEAAAPTHTDAQVPAPSQPTTDPAAEADAMKTLKEKRRG